MIWPAILLSISGYGWFLVISYNMSAAFHGVASGLLGLFFLSIIPVMLSFATNRKFVPRDTVFKITFINLTYYVLYALLTFLFNTITGIYALIPLLYFWQFLSWVLGTFLFYNPSQGAATTGISNVKVTEASLGSFIPAVFLLTFMEFPTLLLLTIISFWFIAFTLTLALGGKGASQNSAIRQDIIVFHAVVPLLAAIGVYFLFFSKEFTLLLQSVQRAMVATIMYIFNLLSWMMGRSPQPGFSPPINNPIGFIPEGTPGTSGAMPPWLIWPLLVLALFFVLYSIFLLVKLLKIRLRPTTNGTNRPRPPFTGFRQSWKWFFLLIRNLLKATSRFLLRVKAMSKIPQNIQRRWLPAKTPNEQIFRSYQAFLQFGHKSGHPRMGCETPLEYIQRLQETSGDKPFPTEEIKQLTLLFLETLYSNKPVSWPQAKESKLLFKKIVAKKASVT